MKKYVILHRHCLCGPVSVSVKIFKNPDAIAAAQQQDMELVQGSLDPLEVFFFLPIKKHFHLFLHRLHLPTGKTAPKPSSPSVYSKQDSQSKVSDERVPDFSCWDFFAAEESISNIFYHFLLRVVVLLLVFIQKYFGGS